MSLLGERAAEVTDRGAARPREAVERILLLAEHLGRTDRMLLDRYFRQGMTASDIASATGLSRFRVKRRVVRCLKRMHRKDFQLALIHLGSLHPRELRPLLKRVMLEGQSLRTVARRTGRTLHVVRRDLRRGRALLALLHEAATRRSSSIVR